MTGPNDPQEVLFVCTGNYHRSRFAELLFNAVVRERGLLWRAGSRGTDVEGSRRFIVGQISPQARQALEARGLDVLTDLRDPRQLTEHDLAAADLVIAVCEDEHRPHIERGFASSAERVEYWNVHDVPITPADEGLMAIEQHVHALVERLAPPA